MVGKKQPEEKLNNTLLYISNLLNKNNVKNWFIGYGTLLGIIRNNNCIDGDDDVDIIIEHANYDILNKLLKENNIPLIGGDLGDYIKKRNRKFRKTRTGIIKTEETDDYASIDFYMATIDEKGNFYDVWENVVWTNCYDTNGKLFERPWKDTILYIPANPEQKLRNRYGKDWGIRIEGKKWSRAPRI